MNDAIKVRKALEARAEALEAEASQMVSQDRQARDQVGTKSLQVFIKRQVAQEFRSLADQISTL